MAGGEQRRQLPRDPATGHRPRSWSRAACTRRWPPARCWSTTRVAAAAGAIPFQRDPQAVLEDVREGYVTAARAATDYGVVIDVATLSGGRGGQRTTARRGAPLRRLSLLASTSARPHPRPSARGQGGGTMHTIGTRAGRTLALREHAGAGQRRSRGGADAPPPDRPAPGRRSPTCRPARRIPG